MPDQPQQPSTPSATTAWTDLCAWADVPDNGSGKYIELSDRSLAVFRITDATGEPTVKVLDDRCPHAGGSLSAGRLDKTIIPGGGETCVVCPWHGWPFDISTGICPDSTAFMVRTHPARVRQGRVEAQLR